MKLADAFKEHRRLAELHAEADTGKTTVGAALELYRAELKADASIKPRTVEDYEERITALLKSWPELKAMDVRKITAMTARSGRRSSKKIGAPAPATTPSPSYGSS